MSRSRGGRYVPQISPRLSRTRASPYNAQREVFSRKRTTPDGIQPGENRLPCLGCKPVDSATGVLCRAILHSWCRSAGPPAPCAVTAGGFGSMGRKRGRSAAYFSCTMRSCSFWNRAGTSEQMRTRTVWLLTTPSMSRCGPASFSRSAGMATQSICCSSSNSMEAC